MRHIDWLEAVSSATALLSADGESLLAWNSAARTLLAAGESPRTAELRVPLPLAQAIGPSVAAAITRHLRDPEPSGADWLPLLVEIGGRRRRIVVGCKPYADGWVLSIEPRETLAAMELTEKTFRDVLDAIPVGIDLFDADYNALFCNAYVISTLGYYGTNTAQSFDLWFRNAYPEPAYRAEAEAVWNQAVEAVRNGAAVFDQGDWWVRCEDGEVRRLRFILQPLGRRNLQITLDMTEQYRTDSHLRQLAFHDALTGASTRGHFRSEGERVVQEAQAAGRPVSLMLLDLDHFKDVNDRYGHAAGDRVLKEVASRCRAIIGAEALLARIGGDEFVVLLPRVDEPAGTTIAAALRDEISERAFDVGTGVALSVSIGVFCGPVAGLGLDEMMAIADEQLYAAKRGGRRRFAVAGGRL